MYMFANCALFLPLSVAKKSEGMRNARAVQKRSRKTREENISNGTKDEPDVVILQSSSSESQPKDSNSGSESESEEAKSSDISNLATSNAKSEEDNENEEDDDENEEEEEEKEEVNSEDFKKKKKAKTVKNENIALHRFPMHRIRRIVRSEASGDLRIAEEAVFLINKASEEFLGLFSEEAYACSVQEHKNYVAYKHLSSIVAKQKRFDFLTDFIPEQVKAEDALEERKSAGT